MQNYVLENKTKGIFIKLLLCYLEGHHSFYSDLLFQGKNVKIHRKQVKISCRH